MVEDSSPRPPENEQNRNQDQLNAGSDPQQDNNSVQAAGTSQDKEAKPKRGQQSPGVSKSSDDDSSATSEHSARSPDDDSASDRSSSGNNQPRSTETDKEAQRKGGQESHGLSGDGR